MPPLIPCPNPRDPTTWGRGLFQTSEQIKTESEINDKHGSLTKGLKPLKKPSI